MSVRKRTWRTAAGEEKQAWVASYRDGAGVRRLKTFQRKKDADVFASKTHVEVREGTHVADRATVTVREAGENWIKTGEATGLERSTLDQYRDHVTHHITPLLGQTRLAQLSVPGVRRFQDRLREEGRSPAMVRKITVSLGSLIADAQDRGHAARNPVREMARGQRGKVRQAEKRRKPRLQIGVDIPNPAEAAAIIEAAKGRWRPLIITAIFTGLRSSELRGLRWSDVDLDNGTVHVRQRADQYRAIGMPKSDAAKRSIPIGTFVANTLKQWKLACPKGDLDLVFPNGKGNIENAANIRIRGLIKTEIAAGVTAPKLDDEGKPKTDKDGKPIITGKYPGIHVMRHFFASWCISPKENGGLGLDPKTVQTRLGHSSIVLTMDCYSHLLPQRDDKKALATAETALLKSVNAA